MMMHVENLTQLLYKRMVPYVYSNHLYHQDHYFGRNLDLQFSYNETVTITPQQLRL